MNGLLLALHVLAAVFWVGGMAFAWGVLRPASAETLDGPARLRLWRAVLGRFLAGVWVAVVLVLASGYGIAFGIHGGFAHAGLHIHAMHGLAWVMTVIFVWLYFLPWQRLRAHVDAERYAAAADALGRIRHLVAVNLILGIITVTAGAGGRFWI